MNAIGHALGIGLPQLLGILGAYVLGCLNTGYYLVRWKTGQDLRAVGSGNAGSKNVGRILGPWGFGAALAGDMLKGAIAVAASRLAGWSPAACIIVILAVTAGHNWPAQLGFRGGKGIATSYAALLVFDPILAGLMLGICALLLAVSRRFTLSAVVSYALSPVLALLCGYPAVVVVLFIPLACLVVLPHRRNLQEEFNRRPAAAQS
jgi:glycerol-3-phosphate acyltransferase PlsY